MQNRRKRPALAVKKKSVVIASWLQYWQLAAALMLLTGLAFFASWGIRKLAEPNTLPFHHVRISATDQHIPLDILENVVSTHLQGGFFSLQADELRTALMQLAWVKSVDLQRNWPDQLVVQITEQQAAAQWGKTALINTDGVMFTPPASTFPANLPQLMGPTDDSLVTVWNEYQTLQAQLKTIGLTIQQLQLTARQSWQMTVDQNITIFLGQDDVQARFNRFIKLYPKIIGDKLAQVLVIDLRYPNGFAVQWRPAATVSPKA